MAVLLHANSLAFQGS